MFLAYMLSGVGNGVLVKADRVWDGIFVLPVVDIRNSREVLTWHVRFTAERDAFRGLSLRKLISRTFPTLLEARTSKTLGAGMEMSLTESQN